MDPSGFERLHDYRLRVAEIYAQARAARDDPLSAWRNWRAAREALFLDHPQSALDEGQRRRFAGLPFFEYRPELRFVLPLDTGVEPQVIEVALQEDGPTRLRRFGRFHLPFADAPPTLAVYWVEGYGGGVFLPFGDATNGTSTYGGGRYLLDSIKGASLGRQGELWILDFNYAYNPSCAYNSRWHCPLAPIESRLSLPIEAGEKAYPDAR